MSFIYTPRVQQKAGVVTPDVLIDRAYISSGGKGELSSLPIDRVTTKPVIQVATRDCAPNAAVAVIASGAGPLISVASNHGTQDEAAGGLSCVRPVSREAWRLSEISEHLDRVTLRLVDVTAGNPVILQEGAASDVGDFAEGHVAAGSVVLYAGLPMMSTPAGPRYVVELEDSVLGRSISCAYAVEEI